MTIFKRGGVRVKVRHRLHSDGDTEAGALISKNVTK